jgi:lipopolysaccharide transport system ATP-binding protein
MQTLTTTNATTALSVENVGKCFRIYSKPRDRLLQSLWGKRRQLYREFWALRDVSFSLERGQTLGIVGRNGSGKSTLLQLICGTLTPTHGSVTTQGRIGALLELGSGFNPEFSGRENVFLNGSLLGLSQREIRSKLDDILTFADIGDFIDQPVKTYSSGMAVRLAFAVQAHTDPELLVVDEALAVGDELFQKKCYARLENLKQNGTSILLVTHSCAQIIEHCDVAMLLHRGRQRLWGDPKVVTSTYQRLCHAPDEAWDTLLATGLNERSSAMPSGGEEARAGGTVHDQPLEALLQPHLDPNLEPSSTVVYEPRGIEIQDVNVLSSDGKHVNVLPLDTPFSIEFTYRSTRALERLYFGCHLASLTGTRITGHKFPADGKSLPQLEAQQTVTIRFSFKAGLVPGTYFIGGGVWSEQEQGFLHRVVDFRALRIMATRPVSGIGLCDLSAGPAELIRPPAVPAPAGT